MNKFKLTLLIVLVPSIVFANDAIGGVMKLFYGIFAIVVLGILISFISAIYYLIRRKESAFTLSGTLSSIVFLFGIILEVMTENETIEISSIFFIPSLLVLTILSSKKTNDNKAELIWHCILASSLILLFSRLISLIQFFNIEILNSLYYLTYLIYPMYIYGYVKSMLAINKQIEQKRLFMNVNLICIFAFLTSELFNIITISNLLVLESFIGSSKPFLIVLTVINFTTIIMTPAKKHH
ncbi:MAG: hypothetical protein ACK44D_02905 [Bacteroidia bacterium]